MLATWALAFICGLGVISAWWLIGCFILGFARGLHFAGRNLPSGDFREQTPEQFALSTKLALFSTAFTIIAVVIWFAIGYGAKSFA